jgi:site-specific DNA recombinase
MSPSESPDATPAIDYQRLYHYRFRGIDQGARQAVWNEIRTVLEDPQHLAAEFRRRLDELHHGAGDQNQAAVDRQIDGLRRGIARLIDSYTEGVIDHDEFQPRISGLKERLGQAAADPEDAISHRR